MERGFTAGVSGIENPTGQDGVRPARTTLPADIAACPSPGATARQPQPDPLLDTIEGMTVAGRDRTGRPRVLLVSDGNQNADHPPLLPAGTHPVT